MALVSVVLLPITKLSCHVLFYLPKVLWYKNNCYDYF